MKSDEVEPPKRVITEVTIVVVILLILAIVVFSYILTRGVSDDMNTVPDSNPPSTQNVTDPNNGSGGSTGAGNLDSNDPAISTPSPAGGVDTNQVPAGGTSAN